MSLLSRMSEALAPLLPAAAVAGSQVGADMAKVLAEFREQRAEDFAALADRAGRSGVRLAAVEGERDAWRTYAHDLERLCLAAGLDMPAAPDDD